MDTPDEYDNLTYQQRLDRVRQVWRHLESHWGIYDDQLGWRIYYELVEAEKTRIEADSNNPGVYPISFIGDTVTLNNVRSGLRLLGWTEEQVR